jgi:hypothetical protein
MSQLEEINDNLRHEEVVMPGESEFPLQQEVFGD